MQSRGIQFQREKALLSMGLPRNLINLIKDGTLFDEIEYAYSQNEILNKMIDKWEEVNPELCKTMPWYAAREQWKADGRPLPEWYEILLLCRPRKDRTFEGLRLREITVQLTHEHAKTYHEKLKQAKKIAKKKDQQKGI